MLPVRVLIACEVSGIIRDAFVNHFYDAYSCDLEEAQGAYPERHIQDDVRNHLYDAWDLIIAHPPCKHLAISGARWFAHKDPALQADAIEFATLLRDAPAPHICIENPISVLSTAWEKPNQIINPWQFGHPEHKPTCFWLQNLPSLIPTNTLPHRTRWENQTPTGQNNVPPGPNQSAIRARTYPGIAHAMASQWPIHILRERTHNDRPQDA